VWNAAKPEPAERLLGHEAVGQASRLPGAENALGERPRGLWAGEMSALLLRFMEAFICFRTCGSP
jgi:hypothetical protein